MTEVAREARDETMRRAGPEIWWNSLSETARTYWLGRCASRENAWEAWNKGHDDIARLKRLIRRLAEPPDGTMFLGPILINVSNQDRGA
jgi:hypothetical protein